MGLLGHPLHTGLDYRLNTRTMDTDPYIHGVELGSLGRAEE